MNMRVVVWSVIASSVLVIGMTGCGSNNNMEAKTSHPQTQTAIHPKSNKSSNISAKQLERRYYTYNVNHTQTANPIDRNYVTTNNGSKHSFKKMVMNDKIAKRLEGIHEIQSAKVLVTDRNAYVGVALKLRASITNKQGSRNSRMKTDYMDTERMGSYHARTSNTGMQSQILSNQLISQIKNEVKQMEPNCQEVFVSTDSSLIERLNQYTQYVKQGHQLSGLNVEFQNLANYVFPLDRLDDKRTRMLPRNQ
ncbi:YhcN/YlaJ family sporulation lipoprotein [Paenibacillus sp. ACRRX]|uniref:YhcN/YlaJ family sporulation lipoprotein n=1 Tax=Paenibacillus sp. ACRRX TaxID=2918206 RepID=UPI001EF713EF|nr:YhcN/YlaJ family sporulation lipoprotein [Paenibacillus sp. ACRRX]MCG7407181.1 YhcN/YlaJ family sporulation lipoprotein [Paenibacillus sp. ACRRX]